MACQAMFIGHIARMLQPSTVIATIVDEAKGSLDSLYPSRIGQSPDRRGPVHDEASARMERPASLTVEAETEGYLRRIEGETLIAAARRNGALVRQRVPIGDYVTPGRPLADVWADDLQTEAQRQIALLAEGPEGEVPTDSDAAQVRRSAVTEILRHAGDAT